MYRCQFLYFENLIFLCFPSFSSQVWKALLKEMPISVLIRNLGKLTANSVLEPRGSEVAIVCEKLRNEKLLKKVRTL